MTKGCGWYYSSDEEWYGPHKDEASAIAAGQAASDGGKYHTAEYHPNLLYMAILDNIGDRVNGINKEFLGNNESLTDQITRVQWKELELELTKVATEWCTRHNFRQFIFDEMQNKTVHGGENND